MREILHRQVWTARPATVVHDTVDLLAVYLMPGTVYKHPRRWDRDEVPPLYTRDAWRLVDVEWTGGGALILSRPGAYYTAGAYWSDDQASLACWYINLQTPLRRTSIGFDYLDQELDIVISSDLSEWRWKDEQEFNRLVQQGFIPTDRAEMLRALGENVVESRYDADALMQLGWQRWQSPPNWQVPHLPPNWDAPNLPLSRCS